MNEELGWRCFYSEMMIGGRRRREEKLEGDIVEMKRSEELIVETSIAHGG